LVLARLSFGLELGDLGPKIGSDSVLSDSYSLLSLGRSLGEFKQILTCLTTLWTLARIAHMA